MAKKKKGKKLTASYPFSPASPSPPLKSSSPSPPTPSPSTPVHDTCIETQSLAMSDSVAKRFMSSLKTYYNIDALSDVTIVCENEVFKVHRLILSIHSAYFAKELSGNWKEAAEGKVEIKDFEPSVVEAMLRFMYSFDYSNLCGTSSMIYDAQVYQIADKYDVPALKEHAVGKFRTAITTGWSMDDFPLAVNVVYESTPSGDRGLRDVALEVTRKNIDSLLSNDGFSKLLRETSDFAADLVPFLCDKEAAGTRRYRCPSCSDNFSGDFSGGYYYCPKCGHRRSDWDDYQA